jgi:hypothetical protein
MKRLMMVLTIVGLFGAACGSTPPAPSVLPVFSPSPELATPQIDTSSYPTMQAPQTNDNQVVGGFAVNLQRAWRDGKQVYADVCYALPDTSDWTVWAAHLEFGGQAISEFSSSMLSKREAANGQPGQRCDELGFYVPPDSDLSSASLTIESLGAPPSEGEYCSLYMPKIQQTLNERGIAITLDCTEVNGALTMRIAGKPDGMSEEEAQQIVFSDEFYTVKGPWTFSVSLGR